VSESYDSIGSGVRKQRGHFEVFNGSVSNTKDPNSNFLSKALFFL